VLGFLPLALVAALAAPRLAPGPSHTAQIESLYEQASRAYVEERWEDAAEYARHATLLLPGADARRAELLCVRGEALLRAGHAREAVEPFTLVAEGEPDPHRAQALYSGALALEAAGRVEGASAYRRRLREEFPETPWAHRLDGPPDASPPP
jgi:tetratricopeptide (TPR) repeat protein